MGDQRHVNDVEPVRPFGMVVQLFCRKRRAGHKPPRLGEATKFPDFPQRVTVGEKTPPPRGEAKKFQVSPRPPRGGPPPPAVFAGGGRFLLALGWGGVSRP